MHVYRVGDVNLYLRGLLDSDSVLSDLWVQGEISSVSRSQAGHYYFTLKDSAGQIRCVLFRRAGIGVALVNGAAVIAHGRVSLYEATGALQFYVDLVQPEGVGALHLEYERLKAQLDEEGLFDVARKRPLPRYPKRIGVVTSPTGAVLQDMINIIRRRYPLAELVLSPTTVQGDGAAENIALALQLINQLVDLDLIILARGGGSQEELWPFNEEIVARAIYGSRYPVISAVGHETDFTIADYVADLRAPTPSAAAELAVPDVTELYERIESHRRACASALSYELAQRQNLIKHYASRLKALAPDFERNRQQVKGQKRLASMLVERLLSTRNETLRSMSLQMASLSPQGTLKRGYALASHTDTGGLISRVDGVRVDDGVRIQVQDGSFEGKITRV